MFFSSKRSCPPGIVLLLAVNAGDVAQTSDVLARGVDPDSTTDARGRTALHLAAVHGHAGVARALLVAGASTECLTPGDEFTPLRLAAEKGHVSVARVLLDFGARVSARDSIDRATPLHAAAEAGHVAMIVELASRGAVLEARATSGQTPLRWALSLGRVRAVEALLGFGADPNAPDRLGASCLHGIAAMGSDSAGAAFPMTLMNPTSGSQTEAPAVTATATVIATAISAVGSPGELAELLLAYGALPNFVRPPRLPCSASSIDSFVQQTVHASQSHADCQCYRAGFLGRVGDIDSALHGKFVGETPLHVAARESSIMVVEALLRAGADPNIKTSEEEGGMSPLHCAAAPGGEGRGEVPRLLLAAGADPEALAADGVTTPLRLACLNSAVSCVEALLHWEPRPMITRVSRNLRYPLCDLPVIAGLDASSSSSCDTSYPRALEGTSPVSSGPVTPVDNAFLSTFATSSSGLIDASPTSDDGVGSLARSDDDSVGARWGPGDTNAAAGDHGGDGDTVRLAPSVYPPVVHFAPAPAVSSPWPSLSPLEEIVGSRVPSAARDPADDEKIRGMIKRAPADRAWRRRGWLVMLYRRHGTEISSGAGGRAASRSCSAAGKGRRAGAVETAACESRGCQVKIAGSLGKARRDEGDMHLGVLSGVSNRNVNESENGCRRRRGSDRRRVSVAAGGGSCLPRPTLAVRCPCSECRDVKDARARCFRRIPACSSGIAGVQSAFANETTSSCLRKRARPVWGDDWDEGDGYAFEQQQLETSSWLEHVDRAGEGCRGLKRYRVDSGAPFSDVRSVQGRRNETTGVTGGKRVGSQEVGGVFLGTDEEVSSVLGASECGLGSVVRRLFETQGDESILRRVVACL